LQAIEHLRRHQQEGGVHCGKEEVDTLNMCLDEEELAITIFAFLIPPLVGAIILYILVMRPLPYGKP